MTRMKRTMTAWGAVGDGLGALAAHLRARFAHANAEMAAERKAFEKSLAGLVSAMEDGLRTVARTASDPAVRDDVTKTVRSVREALGTTLDEIREQVRARRPTAPAPTPKPAARSAKAVARKKPASATKRTPAA